MSATATEAQSFTGISSSPTATFGLKGGQYQVTMLGTSGSLSLQGLGPDGSTFITMNDVNGHAVTNSSLGTASTTVVELPAGQYQFAGTSPVGATAGVARILH
jgi:hypothetical protein